MHDVAGISIDPSGDGRYLFGLELTSSEKENGFTVTSRLMTVPAKDLSQALEIAGLRSEFPVALTHGSLVVVHSDLTDRELSKISEMLLRQWTGQTDAYIAVADGCSGAEILKLDEKENLRAGLLSAQIRRSAEKGNTKALKMFEFTARYLRGDTVELPLVTADRQGQRIVGSIAVQRSDVR